MLHGSNRSASESAFSGRRWGRVLSVGLFTVLATTAFVGVNPALAAAPTLTVPDRVYPDTGQVMDFSGTDPISGDDRALQVSGLTIGNDGCDPKAANNYDIHDCPRIQMSLGSGEAGLLRLADNTAITNLDANPDVDVIVNSTGAVVEATDSHGLDSVQFNFNGTPTQIADTLAKIQFIPCAQQQGTAAVSPPPGASPMEVDCGATGGNPTDEPIYEEKDSLDGALPTLSIQAINPDAGGTTGVLQIKIKVEGQNAAPAMSAPPGSIDVPAGTTSDVDGQVDVVDAEMCNFTICGNPYTDPGLKETDDQMLLVVWIPESMTDTSVCGTFSLRGGAFPSVGGGSLTSVHTLLTDVGGAGLHSDQAAAIEATLSPAAQLLDLSTQSGGPLGTNRVFAGIAALDDVKYSLSQIDYNAPAADATCHLNVAVSDLGNNGMPIAYVGSQFGGAENPHPGYEVPDAKGAATSLTFNVQDGHPDVTISQILPSQLGDPAGPNKPSGFRITFNAAVDPASFDASDLSLATSNAPAAALGLLVAVTPGLEYTVPVTATGDGKITLTMAAGAACAAGHYSGSCDSGFDSSAPTLDDNEITWDQTGPTVTIEQKLGQGDPTSTSPITFEVKFSDTISTAPIGFDASDISFTGSTAGGSLAANVTQPDLLDLKTYDVTVSGMTTSGVVVASVLPNAIVDSALNGSDASTSVDNSVTWQQVVDNTPPSVTINQGSGQGDPTSGSPVVFDVVFSEPVTGFATGDVTLSGSAGATTATVVPLTSSTYTVNVTGMSVLGTVIATIGAGVAQDAASNPSNASTSTDNTVTWNVPPVDNTPPSVTINQGSGQGDPTSGSPVVFDVVFSEPVTGFATGDVTLSGTAGATTATVVPLTSSTYTVNVTGMSVSGTVIASIGVGVAQDAAANPSLASTSTDNTVTWDVPPVDNTPPSVTINQAAGQPDPATTTPITFTVIFSEPVADFAAGDVTLGGSAGATTATVSQPNPADFTVYQVDVGGMSASGTVVATIAAGAAHDAANNPNNASTSADNQVTINYTLSVNTPGGTVTATVQAGCQFNSLTSAAPQVPPPANVTLPFGQLSFSASCAPNALVTFQLTLPSSVNAYYKLIGNSWQSFTYDGETGAQINGNIVTVTIRDNGRGDSDPTLGQVADPAAPAIRATIPATGSNTEPLLWLAVATLCAGFVMLRTSRRQVPVRVR